MLNYLEYSYKSSIFNRVFLVFFRMRCKISRPWLWTWQNKRSFLLHKAAQSSLPRLDPLVFFVSFSYSGHRLISNFYILIYSFFFNRSRMNMVILWHLMETPEKCMLTGVPPWPTPLTLEFHGLCANRAMPHNQWYF